MLNFDRKLQLKWNWDEAAFNLMWILLFIVSPIYVAVEASSYVDPLDSFTDSLLREVLFGRTIGDSDDPGRGGPPSLFGENFEPSLLEESKAFEARKEPSIRDKEYLEHSSLLFGNQYPNEGLQRQKPDGSLINPLKNNGVLPAYCLPPNPCPMGYTSADGCLEESNFENTAAFSREYQANQKCMCDTEHMFDCPGSTRENEIDALARTFENEDLAELALDRLIKTMEPLNPLLEGEKLPVVAKKAPSHSIK